MSQEEEKWFKLEKTAADLGVKQSKDLPVGEKREGDFCWQTHHGEKRLNWS